MRPRWRAGRSLRRADPFGLVADCEAFLSGHYAERVAGSDRVPVWAWTNLLAHGTEEALRSEVAAPRPALPASGRWRAARAYLAAELLETVDRGCPLAELQATVLVPTELALAARLEVEHWDCGHWVGAVRAALDEHRHARS